MNPVSRPFTHPLGAPESAQGATHMRSRTDVGVRLEAARERRQAARHGTPTAPALRSFAQMLMSLCPALQSFGEGQILLAMREHEARWTPRDGDHSSGARLHALARELCASAGVPLPRWAAEQSRALGDSVAP